MCLIVFGWQVHPRYDLIVAANRDEQYARPTLSAHWWDDMPTVFGGRDEQAGGAWCAADIHGRVAAVTNVREPLRTDYPCSRGWLVRDAFELRHMTAHADRLMPAHRQYGPFNLLLADDRTLAFMSNRGQRRRLSLRSGIHAVSNGHWGDHWPKTNRATQALRQLVAEDAVDVDNLFALLAKTGPAMQQHGGLTVSPDTEPFLSELFMQGDTYGTRASTVMLRSRNGRFDFHERGFDRDARVTHDIHEHWDCT